MLIFLPLAVAGTLVLGLSSFGTEMDGTDAHARQAALNLIVNHNRAYTLAVANGQSAGPVSVTNLRPFRNNWNWQSELVASGSRRMLLTWPDDTMEQGIQDRLYRELKQLFRRKGHVAMKPGSTFHGLYGWDADGNAFVGETPAGTRLAGIAASTPILGSIVQ